MKSLMGAWIISIFAMIFTFFLYASRIGGDNFILLTDILAIVFSFVVIVLGVICFRIYQFTSLHGKSLFMILMGMSLWFCSELLWFLFGSKVHLMLEILRLLGYIPITIGFFYILQVSDPKFRSHKKNIIIFLAGLIGFGVIYLALMPVFLGSRSIIDTILTNGYIIVDFSLLFGIVLLLKASLSYKGSQLGRAMLLFAIGFFMVFLFDLIFAINYQDVYPGQMFELLWLFPYIFISLGFFYNYYIILQLRKNIVMSS